MSSTLLRSACAAAAAVLLFASCRDGAPAGPPGAGAPVVIKAALAGTDVRALAVIVSGPAIPVPIVANVDVSADMPEATLTMQVPVGGQRTFVARGFDASGEVTHEGMATVTVRPSANPPVAIRMYPRTGDVPIVIGVGTYALAIVPSTPQALAAGTALQLSAAVSDAGTPVPGATASWGSLNPVVASVDAAGLVTALVPGTTTIYAMYGGSAASVDVTVYEQPLPFAQLVASMWYTCALDTGGAAWCWGDNSSGQLGDGTFDDRARPAPVSGGLRFTSISAGLAHVCALTASGQAWCWGYNAVGALGTGGTGAPASSPQPVAGGLTFASIEAGVNRSCGITAAGALWCWGIGIPGAIGLAGGDGTSYSVVAEPMPITVPGGPWASVDVRSHAACALSSTGTAACATSVFSGITTASASGVAWTSLQLSDFEWVSGQLAYSTLYSWACGLTAAGDAMCWGDGGPYGALGAGALVDGSATPVAVSGPQGWDAITLGGNFACARRGTEPACWGRNDAGQLGDGTLTARGVPGELAGSPAFAQLTAGFTHACGLRTDGTAACWGANLFGELGDGTTTTRTVPTPVDRSPQP